MKRKWLLFLILFTFSFSTIYSREEYISGKVIALISEEKVAEDETNIKKILKYKIKILSGEETGSIKEVSFPIYKEKQYNIDVEIGDKIVLYKSYDTNNIEAKDNERIDISDIDKRDFIYFLFLILFVSTIIIAKKKGIKSIIALVVTILFIIKFFIPAIAKGYSPILSAILISIFSTIITIYYVSGFSKKSLIAILGTTSGLIIAGLVSYSFIKGMKLIGYGDPEILGYLEIIEKINLRELISAGVIIGSLGAIMDVSVSISSSINEIYQTNPKLSEKKLYSSGIKIGNDIIGTMINTLILAYVGASLLTLILLYLQSADYPLIRILNYEDIVIEILRAVCGSLGIIVTVPLTAYIAAKIYKKY